MSSPVPTLVVDDEAPARGLMESYVTQHAGLELVGSATSGSEALLEIERLQPALVLLDVEMPELDGFQVLEELVDRDAALPKVVFVTAFDRYAVRAFDAQAVDYLMKPVSAERFEQAVERCLEQRDPVSPSVERLLEDALQRPPKRMLIRHQGRIVPVPVESIDWIEAEGDYVRIHLGDHGHLVERTLQAMESLLEPRDFLRIHRSALVNLKRVRELRSAGSGRYRLVLKDGTELFVSRKYSPRFRGELL